MNTENSNTAHKFIISVIFIGYIIGTVTHLIHFFDVLKLGFIPSAHAYGIHPIVNGYWLSLTLIDQIIAFLLLKKRNVGVVLAFINIFINVFVNSSLQILALPPISFKSIYDTLGNIYNSLQIALLLFSVFTLPLFLLKEKVDFFRPLKLESYIRFYFFLPFAALLTGLAIHIVGLVNVIIHFESIWITWVHISMTIIDASLLFALSKRFKIGYIFGILGFSIFGLIQAWFAMSIFIGQNCSFNLSMAITITLCCLAVSSLIMSKDTYNKVLIISGI